MKNAITAIIALIAIIAVGALVGVVNIPGLTPGTTIGWNRCGTDLSYMFHYSIDKVDPTLITQAELQCSTLGGQWYDENNKFGCFEMNIPAFDPSDCSTVLGTLFKTTCEGVRGTWVCNNVNVGCSC